MNPVSIRTYNANTFTVVCNHFYNTCLTEGEHSATAESIFAAVKNNFDLCITVDNGSTMVGKRNSLASRFKDKNSEIFISGCPCHLAHIVTSHAND